MTRAAGLFEISSREKEVKGENPKGGLSRCYSVFVKSQKSELLRTSFVTSILWSFISEKASAVGFPESAKRESSSILRESVPTTVIVRYTDWLMDSAYAKFPVSTAIMMTIDIIKEAVFGFTVINPFPSVLREGSRKKTYSFLLPSKE